MEDDLWWKTNFGGEETYKEGKRLRFDMLTVLTNMRSTMCYGEWKMTFCGRRSSVEDNLWGKTTFNGRQPLVEDDLWWKTTFGGRGALVEDYLWWKTTFNGRQPSVEDNLR